MYPVEASLSNTSDKLTHAIKAPDHNDTKKAVECHKVRIYDER